LIIFYITLYFIYVFDISGHGECSDVVRAGRSYTI